MISSIVLACLGVLFMVGTAVALFGWYKFRMERREARAEIVARPPGIPELISAPILADPFDPGTAPIWAAAYGRLYASAAYVAGQPCRREGDKTCVELFSGRDPTQLCPTCMMKRVLQLEQERDPTRAEASHAAH